MNANASTEPAARRRPLQADRPAKPYPTFPLGAHANGQWYCTRRIGGAKEFFYFGRWDEDRQGERAYAAWLIVADDLNAGRRPRPATSLPPADAVTALTLADRFTTYAERRYKAGEIKVREFGDVRLACMGHFLDAVGEETATALLDRSRLVKDRRDPVTPLQQYREFLQARMGAYAMHRNLTKVRSMLRWGRKNELVPRAIDDHDALKRLPKRLVRREARERAAQHGHPIYSPAECQALLVAAATNGARGGPMLAMFLLGLNGGCDASWLSEVPAAVIDLSAGFVDWVRPKTEELCRFPLWPITIEAIRQWTPNRPKAANPEHRDRLFITARGNLFVREKIEVDAEGNIGQINPDDAIGKEFVKIERAAGVTKQRGRRFKALRRTHSTAANDITDRDARRMVMGHGFEGMDPHYVRGSFPADRLRRVTDHVGQVVFGHVGLSCPWPRAGSTEAGAVPLSAWP